MEKDKEFVQIGKSVEKQTEPGDHVLAILEAQPQLLDQRQNVDAVALHTGVHPVGMVAGLAVEPGAALALPIPGGTGLRDYEDLIVGLNSELQ